MAPRSFVTSAATAAPFAVALLAVLAAASSPVGTTLHFGHGVGHGASVASQLHRGGSVAPAAADAGASSASSGTAVCPPQLLNGTTVASIDVAEEPVAAVVSSSSSSSSSPSSSFSGGLHNGTTPLSSSAASGVFVASTTATTTTFVESSHKPRVDVKVDVKAAAPEVEASAESVATTVIAEDEYSEEEEPAVERTPEEIEAEIEKLTEKKGSPLKILFLSADTGGGHRASAESLGKSFQMHYPGTTYDLLDVWSPSKVWPYYTLVPAYKHMSAHPFQWKLFYHLSNNFLYELVYNFHTWAACERGVRRRIVKYNPDVVVSVHPTMNNVPLKSTRKIAKKLGKDIPFFTVVTDFGSAHTTWFHRGVDKMFVASERIRKLAKRRGRLPDDKLVMSGLPIRHDFAVQAERLGDRTSESGLEYQRSVRENLGVDTSKKMVLVMGGGEGVGSLSDIVDGLYAKFRKSSVDVTIYVVCGRNEKLKTELATKCWDTVLHESHLPKKKLHPLSFLRPHRSRRIQRAIDKAHAKEEEEERCGIHHDPGRVNVVPLGFVSNMAEYMVAADVLVTKAGPGTIAEAAAVGLPVMLTSFLPGQEAGNVNVVLDGGFGDYCEEPDGIADEVSCWLGDPHLMKEMSRRAREVGHPHAASDIALEIGELTHQRMAMNAITAGGSMEFEGQTP